MTPDQVNAERARSTASIHTRKPSEGKAVDTSGRNGVEPPTGDPVLERIGVLGYQPALDGIRAVAVAVVVLYHGKVPGFANGGIGVDVFFVLSGFLITTLLVEEISATGSLSLRRFYRRRFARLFPAYLAVATFCSIAELLVHRGGTFRGVLTSFVYMSNWSHIVYPDKGLGMLNHTWTLSIEEQFYLVWPLLLLLICRLVKGLTKLAWSVAILILASGIEVAILASAARDHSYYLTNATDARAPMLLSGALLAVVLARKRTEVNRRLVIPGSAQVLGLVALVGLIALSGVILRPFERQIAIEWPSIVIGTLLMILCCVGDNGPLRRLLSSRPLVATGKVSYGLYLWHFPVFFLVDTRIGMGSVVSVGLATVLSVGVTVLSYRYLEVPIRRRLAAR